MGASSDQDKDPESAPSDKPSPFYPVTSDGSIDLVLVTRTLREANQMAQEDLNGRIIGIGPRGEIMVEIPKEGTFLLGNLSTKLFSINLDRGNLFRPEIIEEAKARLIELQNLISRHDVNALKATFKPKVETVDFDELLRNPTAHSHRHFAAIERIKELVGIRRNGDEQHSSNRARRRVA